MSKEKFLSKYGSASHLDKIIGNGDKIGWDSALDMLRENPSVNSGHIDKLLNHRYSDVRAEAIRHQASTKENLDKAVDDSSQSVRGEVAYHDNATSSHIDKLIKDPVSRVRFTALENKAANSTHIDVAMHDSDDYVRFTAANSPIATKDQLTKLTNDKSLIVANKAKSKLQQYE